MRERPWHALGEALRSLREALDLSQTEAVDRSGEKMADRAFRGYELGEQRPGRDRLLNLLKNSFELRERAEINRYLQLAHYAVLSDSDVRQLGIEVSAGVRQVGGSTHRPTDFRIEASTLVATDAQGRDVWRHTFPSRLFHSVYDQQTAIKRCTFGDIDGDGSIETLFVYLPIDFQSVGATLFCFGQDGAVRWEFVPGKAVKDSTGREYSPPYFISNVSIVTADGSVGRRVLVSSNHYLHNPNQIAMLAPDGSLISEYWHSGHLLYVAQADLNSDGVDEILLGGVNNGYGQATLVIFDPLNISGASTQPGRQILGFSAGTEKVRVFFPKTCLAKTAPYNRVSELRVTRERRIMLAVVEGVSESKNPGVMIYELDFALNVLNARPDSHLQENHRILEAQELLDHSWTEDENRELRRRVVVQGEL